MIVNIVLGTLLLFAGRRLFWLFVGVMGSIAGMYLAATLAPQQPQGIILLIGIVSGILGAILAVFLQRLAVAVAGFVAGGYFLVMVVNLFTDVSSQWELAPFLIGGVIGAVLVASLLDWALIFLSALAGATLIVQALQFSTIITLLLFLVLLLIGMGVQYSQKKNHG